MFVSLVCRLSVCLQGSMYLNMRLVHNENDRVCRRAAYEPQAVQCFMYLTSWWVRRGHTRMYVMLVGALCVVSGIYF